MIKKIFLAAAVALTFGIAAQAQKIAIVSADQIVSVMPEFTEVQNRIAEASKQYESEYAKLQEEFQKKFAEYQELEKDANSPQTIKDRRLQEIQDLDQKAQQFVQTAQSDLQRQQAQLMQPVQEKLMQTIKEVGAANGFALVLPADAALYANPAEVTDITPLVKAQLGIK